MNASGFVWYELMTSGDLDAAVAFYSKVVGWDVRDSGMPGMKYMIFGKDGKDVGGMMSWSSIGMTAPTIWKGHIYTADVDAEAKAVVADGGKENRAPQDIPGVGRFSAVSDPQGAEYLLFQPNQQYAPPRLAQNDLGNVGWHQLMTSDWEKAWTFYSKHYGWEKDFAMDMGPAGIYQTFRTGGGKYSGGMMTMPASMPDQNPSWSFYFTVESADAAAEQIKSAGGTVLEGPMDVPGGSRVVHALDPQGGYFAVTTPQIGKPQQM
jgi:predicted enzyme related to lactoylglutathione lyase